MDQSTVKKPPYFMIIIMMIGSFIALLNNSLMNNALPTIMEEFQIEQYSTVQWLTTGYMLVLGILIPTSAFFITKFKSRHIFITSMTIFTIGTILAACSQNFEFLLAGRFIQGAGASLLSPLLMNVMLTVFTRKQRGAAMGVYGLVIIVAPAFGPTISGFLLETFSWRALFILIAPIALISLLLAFWKLESVLEQYPSKLDFLSLIFSTIGFASLLYGFSRASSKGWGDIEVYGMILVGVIALSIFVMRQLKIDNPLLNVRVYKYPMYALGSALSVLLSMILYSAMILLPLYFQNIQDFSPIKSGLILLPGSLAMGLVMPISGKLYDKVGILPLALPGFAMVGASLYALSNLDVATAFSYTIIWFAVFSIGIGLLMMPIQTNGINQLPSRFNASGTAINSTLQQVAGAIGSAVFVTIMTSFAKNRGEELMVEQKNQLGTKIASYAPEQLATLKHDLSQQAMLDAINHAMQIGLGITVVAFIFALFLRKSNTDEESFEGVKTKAN